jgi:hypothetical protein
MIVTELIVLLFLAPFFWGTQEREAAAPKPSDRISGGAQEIIFGGVSEDLLGGNGKAEGAKVPGAGIGPKPCPGKCAAEKECLPNSDRSAIGSMNHDSNYGRRIRQIVSNGLERRVRERAKRNGNAKQ